MPVKNQQYDTIIVDCDGAIDIVSLNRPDRLNAISQQMIADLLTYFRGASTRDSTRVILLRSVGDAFCAGIDLAPPEDGKTDPATPDIAAMLKVQESLSDLVLAMHRCPQPIIALIQGAAAGGGFGLPLAADVRFCTPQARFIPSFLKIGLSACDMGVSYFLPRIIGRAQAAQIMMAGETVDADRASQIGLVSEIATADDLLPKGLSLAKKMLNASPMGLKMTKEVFNLNCDAPNLEFAVAIENRTQVLLGQTEDLREGVAAFLEKRPPDYIGR